MKNHFFSILITMVCAILAATAQDSKPVVKPKINVPANTTKTSNMKSQSKQETIDWILEKFNKYASNDIETNHSNLKDKFAIKYYSWKVKYYDIKYSINENYFNIQYKNITFEYNGKTYIQRERITENNIMIPIYAITSVYEVENELAISTKEDVIKNEGYYVDGSNKIPFKYKKSYFYIPFSFYEESDLGERLNKAFMNLKKYYPPPVNTEKF